MKLDAAAWRDRATALFAIDLRTLALFRVALGAVLACYAIERLPDLNAFFTDDGVLPRAYLLQTDTWSRVSLYLANGETWFALLLWVVTVLAAVSLAVGHRTRLACALLFLLFASLINRNPLILTGGETLLACLLFWSLFLPLAARWSVDATLSRTAPPAADLHRSAASAGLVVQVLSVYFFGALSARLHEGWAGGPPFVQLVALLAPILALSPWATRPLRFVAMLSLMSVHLALMNSPGSDDATFAGLASLTVLLGGWFWDWRARANETRHPLGPKIFYDRDCAFCYERCRLLQTFLALPRAHIAPAQDSQRATALFSANGSWVVIDADDVAHVKWAAFVALLRPSPLFHWLWPVLRPRVLVRTGDALYDWIARRRTMLAKIVPPLRSDRTVGFETGVAARRVAAFFVAAILCWNLAAIEVLPRWLVAPLAAPFRVLRIDQQWNTFATSPAAGWLVFRGRLDDGSEVDVLRPGEPLSWAWPAPQQSPNALWRSYQRRLRDPRFHGYLPYYGDYLCRQWNASAPPGRRLLSFEMTALETSMPAPDDAAAVERHILRRHDCGTPPREQDAVAEEGHRVPTDDARTPDARP